MNNGLDQRAPGNNGSEGISTPGQAHYLHIQVLPYTKMVLAWVYTTNQQLSLWPYYIIYTYIILFIWILYSFYLYYIFISILYYYIFVMSHYSSNICENFTLTMDLLLFTLLHQFLLQLDYIFFLFLKNSISSGISDSLYRTAYIQQW